MPIFWHRVPEEGADPPGHAPPGFDGGAGTVHVVQGFPYTHVRSHTPAGLKGGHLSGGFHDVTLQFNKPIDFASLDADVLVIRGPLGSIVPTGFSVVGDRTYRIDLPPQTEDGRYHFTLLPSLMDAEGFPLDQNANGLPGEPEDSYNFTLIVDTVPPRVTNHAPAGDIAGTVDHVDVWLKGRDSDVHPWPGAQLAGAEPGGRTVLPGPSGSGR